MIVGVRLERISDDMTNPYEPPLNSCGPVFIKEPVSQTFRQQLNDGWYFSMGCIIGLNLILGVFEGAVTEVYRIVANPFFYVFFCFCAAVVCMAFLDTWRICRGCILAKYSPTNGSSFVSGLAIAMTSWTSAVWGERAGFDPNASLCVALLATTVLVTEFGATLGSRWANQAVRRSGEVRRF